MTLLFRSLVLLGFIALNPVAGSAECVIDSPNDVLRGDQSQRPDWRQLADDGDICIWSRSTSRSGIKEVAAAGVIDARASQIVDLVLDCPNYPSVFRYVETCKVVKNHDAGAWVFQQLDLPWPATDRYYTIDIKTFALADGIKEVRWSLVDPSVSGQTGRGVATRINTGKWYLIPAAGGAKTNAVYYLYTHPGGSLPSVLINQANLTALPGVVQDVRRALE